MTFRSVKRERSGFKRFSIVENCKSKNICKYAAMAQQVEHVLGKDEVTSSNLVSSSTKKPLNTVVFLYFNEIYCGARIFQESSQDTFADELQTISPKK